MVCQEKITVTMYGEWGFSTSGDENYINNITVMEDKGRSSIICDGNRDEEWLSPIYTLHFYKLHHNNSGLNFSDLEERMDWWREIKFTRGN
jgi:hypothetical protein